MIDYYWQLNDWLVELPDDTFELAFSMISIASIVIPFTICIPFFARSHHSIGRSPYAILYFGTSTVVAVAAILIIVFAGAIGASIGVLGYFLASFTLYALFGVIVAFLAVARAKHATGRSWLALVAVLPLVNLFLIFMPKSEDAPPEYALPEFMKGHSGLLIAIALFACNTAIEVVSRLYEANVE